MPQVDVICGKCGRKFARGFTPDGRTLHGLCSACARGNWEMVRKKLPVGKGSVRVGCWTMCLLTLALFALPAMVCALNVPVVYVEDIPAVEKVETSVATAEALTDAAGVLLDYETIVEIAPYSVPGLGEITSGTHATEKHGKEALAMRLALAQEGTFCQACKDGRVRCYHPLDDGYAFGVYEIVGELIVERTAFHCDEDYLPNALKECDSGIPPEWAVQ